MSELAPLSDTATESDRVLHVDDDRAFRELTATYLEREKERLVVETAGDAAAGLDRLQTECFDCVVSDYDMPGRNGIEFLRAVREEHPEIPFILFTGKGSEEVASEAVSAGVTDYLQKEGGTDQYTVLANRITNAVEHYRSRQVVERSEQRLRELIDFLPHLLYVVDEDGRYLLANEALAAFHQASVGEIEGATVEEVLGGEIAAQFREDVATVFESGAEKRFPEIEIADPDGEVHVFEPRILPYEVGGADDRAVLGIAVDVTERTERERELERYEAYLQESNDIISILDEAGTVRYQSPSVERILGYDQDALLGREAFEFVHPEDVAEVAKAFSELVADPGGTATIECRFRTADGEWRWLEVRGTNHLEHDAIGGIVTNNRDITERKRRERELRQKERQYQAVFDDPNILVGRIGTDGAVREINRTAMEYVEPALEELTGEPLWETPWFDHSAPLQDDVEEWIERATDGEYVEFEADLERPSGESYTVEGVFRPVTDADSEVVSLLVSAQDTTERRARERQLEALNSVARELMTAETRERVAAVGVEAAKDVLGLEANTIHLYDEERGGLVPTTQTAASEVLVPDPPTFTGGDSIAWRVYDSGRAVAVDDVHEEPDVHNPDTELQSELVLPLGEYGILIASSKTTEAFDEQDVVLGQLLAGSLTTALEQVEQTDRLRTREAELERQNDRLEEFASIVSHDLRNPLRVAEGNVELARAECDSEYLDRVARAHDRMDTLIGDLLTLAREGEQVDELQPVDLSAAVRECWETVETGGAELRVETDLSLRADRSRLRQLLENLIQNAVEHGSTDPPSQAPEDAVEHGSTAPDSQARQNAVEHGSTGSQPSADDAAAEGSDDDVTVAITVGELADGFYVEDDGPGIPDDGREAVFDAGYSTSETGTGFGLRIVEQVAEGHGWDVRVTDGSDGGARFEFTGVERV